MLAFRRRRVGPRPTKEAPAPAAPAPLPAPFEATIAHPTPRFALAVSHTPWRADRAANMAKVRPELLQARLNLVAYREETERADNHVWSRRMWGWGAGQACTGTAYLQDDLRVSPLFWPMLEAIVRAHPWRVIALLTNHPCAPRAYAAGYPGYLCGETLGAGYYVPTPVMGAFLEWRDAQDAEWLRTTCEDFVLTMWLGLTGRRAFSPCPSPIDTLPGIPSTNPAIGYAHRRSYFPWTDKRVDARRDLSAVATWRCASPPDFGPTVANDSRLPRGPFPDATILAAADEAPPHEV